MLRHWLHHLTHDHAGMDKPGVGALDICWPRWRPRLIRYHFQGSEEQAWHEVPPAVVHEVAAAQSFEEAMALIRRACA